MDYRQAVRRGWSGLGRGMGIMDMDNTIFTCVCCDGGTVMACKHCDLGVDGADRR
jgi:hypothetical protein